MKSTPIMKLLSLAILAATLTACDGGDVVLNPTNVNNSVDNSVNNSNNTAPSAPVTSVKCASFTFGGTTKEGILGDVNGDGIPDCTYYKSFVDIVNPMLTNLTIPYIGDGLHIFEGSLVVGRIFSRIQDAFDAGITEGGQGPVLTVEPGTTLVFKEEQDHILINRGSQIRANGTAQRPIVMTSYRDAVAGLSRKYDYGEWGGLLVTGFGITNQCPYSGSYNPAASYNFATKTGSGLTLTGECSVVTEGRAGLERGRYGGFNNNDSSGTLRYVIIKHAGYQLDSGNELNSFSLYAVGDGTEIENIQTYAGKDDGVELWGGAVNITNFISLYTRDDAIDLDEGWKGTIKNALVIAAGPDQGGNGYGSLCIEADGLGSFGTAAADNDRIARGLQTSGTVQNLTCILTGNTLADSATGGGGDNPSTGFRLREGLALTIKDSLVTMSHFGHKDTGTNNYCLRLEEPATRTLAISGAMSIRGSVFACGVLTNGVADIGNGQSDLQWLRGLGNAAFQTPAAGLNPTGSVNASFAILDGFYSLPVSQMKVGTEATPTPVGTHIGAVLKNNDWTAGWAIGMDTLWIRNYP
jgi:hypothetical protein